MERTNSLDLAIDKILDKLGNKIVLATPLGAGKPNHLINALYDRAKKDSKIDLTICTALTLERPKPKSDLERRFLIPFEKRVFADYPDLNYELDRAKGNLPQNIKVIEFYFPPGKYLNDNLSQQNYISSNYTHVCRDMMDRGVNLLLQMVAKKDDHLSFSCNADVSNDMIPKMREQGYPVMVVGEVNQNLPFMFGDAIVHETRFDLVLDRPEKYYKIFGPPKMSISDTDYMIGLYASSLVKDDGELQVGIGSLGDAVIYGLILREKNNDLYQKILKQSGFLDCFSAIINKIGDLNPFNIGLFGATEMMVDGFMELYKNNILKKKVYDNADIQRLINEGVLDPNNIDDKILDHLLERNIIKDKLDKSDFDFLKYWGIFNDNVSFENDCLKVSGGDGISTDLNEEVARKQIIESCLGDKLYHGHLMHAGFFLGPNNFYQWLKNLPEAERKLFAMKSVLKINQLYGHEVIDRLHRKNARFINTCMLTTLSGAHVSDGLESGKVVSGVGGQYNFVAMAQELPDGHSVLTMRSTRMEKGKVMSNIVFNYGHITVPRHMRDILVTEYGVAFLRGKTDEEIIQELLKVADSRFQEELMNKAKEAGKLQMNYEIPKEFKNNYPESYQSLLKTFRRDQFFLPFPFGTDLTSDEIIIGGALKRLKKKMESGLLSILKLLGKALMEKPRAEHEKLFERMDLHNPKSLKEKLYRKLISLEL